MIPQKKFQFWFVTGSQNLYGSEALDQVAVNTKEIVAGLNGNAEMKYEILFKGVLKTREEIRDVVLAANADPLCAGIITWMHTFSPTKMWISGLTQLQKPMLHFATQYNQDIPWDSIDMDFMNLNQAAHGDREFGFMSARLKVKRKVVFGHWAQQDVQARIAAWQRTAAAFAESKGLKVARFGDNMRQVGVTEGDKVEAEIQFGWSVNGYGVGDLVARVNAVTEAQVDALMKEYEATYEFADNAKAPGAARDAIAYQARIEIALKGFLEEGGFSAFTTSFEDLHGLKQLPGLAVQRLMEQGYGFGGEGDWKTAAFVRLMKIIADNKETSFMEDYTYHLDPKNELVLGSHMLEVCPTISTSKVRLEVHPLGIGGKEDPARMVFTGKAGNALNATIVDMGNRFRMVINEVEAKLPVKDMPKLPVARVMWKVLPNLRDGVEAWILAGGAHHSGFSYVVTSDQLIDFADMAGIEYVLIDKDTNLKQLKNELRWSDIAWK